MPNHLNFTVNVHSFFLPFLKNSHRYTVVPETFLICQVNNFRVSVCVIYDYTPTPKPKPGTLIDR